MTDDKSAWSANAREVAGGATQQLNPHLLIVDDDRELCEVLKRYLEAEDFRVSFAHTGDAGTKAATEGSFGLIVLDVMLPDKKGFNVLKDIRQRARTPVLMLTARGEETDRIVGLELGADDYLPKPFSPRELLARIRVVLRRLHKSAANGTGGSRPDNPRLIHFAGWTLDTGARHLLSADKVVVSLSGAEYRLLHT